MQSVVLDSGGTVVIPKGYHNQIFQQLQSHGYDAAYKERVYAVRASNLRPWAALECAGVCRYCGEACGMAQQEAREGAGRAGGCGQACKYSAM